MLNKQLALIHGLGIAVPYAPSRWWTCLGRGGELMKR